MQGIYQILNKINNKVYIGKSINIKNRWNQHKHGLNADNETHFQRAWHKYGSNNFEFLIIEIIEDPTILNDREKYWIAFYKSNDPKFGYNITDGGDGRSAPCSDETKLKISKKLKNMFSGDKHHMYGKHHSDETKEKIRQGNLGKKLSEEHKLKITEKNKLRKHSEETKRKISISNKGKLVSDETKLKIRIAKKGQQLSDETKQKIGNSLRGREAWNKGLTYSLGPCSDKTKQKISESRKGQQSRIIITDKMIPTILGRLNSGEKVSDLAKEYGVKDATIYSLKRRAKKLNL